MQGDIIAAEPAFLNYVQRDPSGVIGQIVQSPVTGAELEALRALQAAT